jgi:transposase
LAEVQRLIALDLGGQAGARQANRQGMPASPDTLLRLVHRGQLAPLATPRVLGLDDWAWKKGHTYGTILVDLERRQVIDLLPDRKAETVIAWLRQHPGIAIISRDRAGSYADAARAGAPEAIQVADRWHLLANLRQALERLLQRERGWVQASRQTEASAMGPKPHEASPPGEAGPAVAAPDQPLRRAERLHLERRERRRGCYEQVLALRAGGMNISAIARQTGLDRRTVRHYATVEQFPEIAPRSPRPGVLSPYLPHLVKRWEEGCHIGAQLLREIREQGYRHSRGTLSDWVARQRRKTTAEVRAESGQPLSPRQASWLLVRRADELSADERAALARIRDACPPVATASILAGSFIAMVRGRHREPFESWLQAAAASEVGELKGFANGLERDQAAVMAALSLPWSNGPVEGHVNRLKLPKRQAYGRASFELLRRRVLAPP